LRRKNATTSTQLAAPQTTSERFSFGWTKGVEGEGVAKAEEDEKDEKAESDTDTEIRAKGGGWDHGRRGGNGGWGEGQKYDI